MRLTVHFLCTFSCVAHVKNVKPHLNKLDNHSTPMIFVGYESGSKAYRVYDPVSTCVHVTSCLTNRRSGNGAQKSTR